MKTILLALALFAGTQILRAQGTAFTYQGRLNAAGAPANGSYDLAFTLFNVGSGGSAVAGPLTNSAAAVSNGLFTVTLDFGSGVFDGTARWLEIAVRTNGASGFVTLRLHCSFPLQLPAKADWHGGINNPCFPSATTLPDI